MRVGTTHFHPGDTDPVAGRAAARVRPIQVVRLYRLATVDHSAFCDPVTLFNSGLRLADLADLVGALVIDNGHFDMMLGAGGDG